MNANAEREQLGARLKAAREYRGFSQEDVATYLAIPRSAVSLMETGDRRVDTLELSKLARLFECSIEELATGGGANVEPESIRLVARAAAKLSEADRAEVVRFAHLLSNRRPSDP